MKKILQLSLLLAVYFLSTAYLGSGWAFVCGYLVGITIEIWNELLK
jgi:hypothetical protein